MATGNQALFDAMIRRQINLQRMTRTEGIELLKILNASDLKVQEYILESGGSWSVKRLGAVRKEIARLREPAMRSVGSSIETTMTGTASQEMVHTQAILQRAVPIEFNFASPGAAAVREAVITTPFGDVNRMGTLAQWGKNLSVADQNRIMGYIQAALVQGLTVPEMAQQVLAGPLKTTANQAEALARTAISHGANTARNAVFAENSDVIQALMWSAMLDGRTSPVCQARDGQHRPASGDSFEGIPEPWLDGAQLSPPAHMRCRSTLIALLSGDGMVDQLMRTKRATVTDTRTGRQRQIDFEAQAAERHGPGWSKLTAEQKRPYRRAVRDDWAFGKGGSRTNIKEGAAIGQVPANTTYNQWLKTQDRAFVNQVLGPKRAAMYLDDGIPLDQFVDKFGQPLTLDQLANVS